MFLRRWFPYRSHAYDDEDVDKPRTSQPIYANQWLCARYLNEMFNFADKIRLTDIHTLLKAVHQQRPNNVLLFKCLPNHVDLFNENVEKKQRKFNNNKNMQ